MCAKWNNKTKVDPHHVVRFFENIKIENTTKPYPIFLEEFSEVLSTGMEYDPRIPSSQYSKLMAKAIDSAKIGQKINPEGIRVALNRIEKEYLQNSDKKYSLLTKVSISFPRDRTTLKFLGSNFIFTNILPSSIDPAFDKTVLPEKLYTEDFPYNYSWLRVITSAKFPTEASEKALECISIFNGVINFLLTYGTTRITTNKHLPLAKIGMAPYYLLYDKNNALVKDCIWYSTDYHRHPFTTDLNVYLKDWRKTLSLILRRISNHPNKKTLLSVLERYSSAQSSTNLEHTFLNFWSLLETLTNTAGESYDKTISRAAALHVDSEYAKSELNHLRVLRNKAIHFGAPINNQDITVFQIKKYVDKLLTVLLLNKSFNKIDFETVGKVLDIPVKDISRRKMVKAIELASKL